MGKENLVNFDQARRTFWAERILELVQGHEECDIVYINGDDFLKLCQAFRVRQLTPEVADHLKNNGIHVLSGDFSRISVGGIKKETKELARVAEILAKYS